MKESRIRSDLWKELAKGVKPSGTIAHIPREFLRGLKTFLGWSDGNISVVLGVSRPAINRKINTADKESLTAPPVTAPGEMDFENFVNANMTPEKELDFLKTYGRQMLSTLPPKSQARMTLYKLLMESSEKKMEQEAEEGKELMVALLNEIKGGFLESQAKVREEFKKQIRQTITRFIEELDANPEKDPVSIRDALLIQVEAFDPCDLVRDIFLEKPNLKQKLDEYVATRKEDVKAPSLCGGGIVGSPESSRGGQQYVQAARRAEREKEKG